MPTLNRRDAVRENECTFQQTMIAEVIAQGNGPYLGIIVMW
jgi:hypothetical protein